MSYRNRATSIDRGPLKWIAGSFFLLMVLAACDSISQKDCLQGDWYQIGLNDGINGYSQDRLSAHQKACSKVDVVADSKAWERGRRDGLKTYCTPSSAYQVGRKGRGIGKVCSASQRKKMQPAYNRGHQYYGISRKIAELDQQVSEARGEISAALKANKGKATVDVFYLQSEIFDLERRIRQLQRDRQIYSVWP